MVHSPQLRPPVCLSVCFGGHPKRTTKCCLDCCTLSNTTRFSIRWCTLAKKLESPPSYNVKEHWTLISNVLHSAGWESCGLTRCVMTFWIFSESLRLNTPQPIPICNEYAEGPGALYREYVEAMGNSLKLFHFIWGWAKRFVKLKTRPPIISSVALYARQSILNHGLATITYQLPQHVLGHTSRDLF